MGHLASTWSLRFSRQRPDCGWKQTVFTSQSWVIRQRGVHAQKMAQFEHTTCIQRIGLWSNILLLLGCGLGWIVGRCLDVSLYGFILSPNLTQNFAHLWILWHFFVGCLYCRVCSLAFKWLVLPLPCVFTIQCFALTGEIYPTQLLRCDCYFGLGHRVKFTLCACASHSDFKLSYHRPTPSNCGSQAGSVG